MFLLHLPIQKGGRVIQLLGVFLCIVHVIGQAAITQTIGEACDFFIQLVMKRIEFISHLLQVLQTEREKTDWVDRLTQITFCFSIHICG